MTTAQTGTAGPIASFRENLLKSTIAWCMERSAFYRARFGELGAAFRGLADLPRLPILLRDEVIDNQPLLLCEQVQPSCVQYTTGTTGRFLTLYRSPAEVAFISEFFTAGVNQRHAGQTVRPLWLTLTSAYHGSQTPVPGWPYVIPAGVYDQTQAEQALKLIDTTFEMRGVEPRVSAVVGGDILLKALTAFLVDRRYDFDAGPVRQLIMTGGYMSAARKRLLGDTWHAAVQDRYSLSEIFGGASEVAIGGPWVFDLHVIPEVVHPRTLAPVDRGVGTLVLTGLYPFMQMMPMVRYYTGDLVEVVAPMGPQAPDLLVRFVGRERRAILDTSGPEVVPLLLPGPLYEILEDIPDIAVTPRFVETRAGSGLEFAGKLHYAVDAELERGRGRITLKVSLRYPHWAHARRTTEVVTQIRSALYQRHPALRARVSSGEVELMVVPAAMDAVTPYNAK